MSIRDKKVSPNSSSSNSTLISEHAEEDGSHQHQHQHHHQHKHQHQPQQAHQNVSKSSAKSRETNGNLETAKSMKNIDRNNYLAQAVTVNNVTVIITEFQPKKKVKCMQIHLTKCLMTLHRMKFSHMHLLKV